MPIRPMVFLKTSPRATKILVRVDDDEVLKAVLLTPPRPHPRALPTLLEAIALWHQAPVHAVLCATTRRRGLGLAFSTSSASAPTRCTTRSSCGRAIASAASASRAWVASKICVTLAAALADLLAQKSLPAFERRLRRYTRPDLLVLDEPGYLPCDSRAADLLYNIISRRHEQRSTIISTNLAFKQWGTTFPGAACVVALVERFAQHCYRIEILGESWRDKHRLDPDRPTPSPSRSRRKHA